MSSDLFRLKDWYIIVPFGVAALALGVWGFSSCQVAATAPSGIMGELGLLGAAVTKTFGLVFLRGMGADSCVRGQSWQISIAQFALPVIAMIGGAKLFFVNLRRDVRVAFAKQARDHVIVCGLGDTGRQMVESLKTAKKSVVAITLDLDHANSLACERLGVPVLKGDATQPVILKQAGLVHAQAVVATTGSDALNLEIGLQASELIGPRRKAPIKVMTEMRTGWLVDRIAGHETASLGDAHVDFQFFNLNVNAARGLLRSAAFERAFAPLRPEAPPHLMVVGFGSVAAELVQRAICSNFALPGMRARVTVLADRADQAQAALAQRAPGVADLADIDFQAHRFSSSDAAAAVDLDALLSPARVDAVVVSVSNDDDALHTALRFRAALDRMERFSAPVFVRLKAQHKLGQFLHHLEAHSLLPDRLVAFGDLHDLTAPEHFFDASLDDLARAVHTVYLEGRGGAQNSPADRPWARLAERFKTSNRAVADHLGAELRFAGLRMSPMAAGHALRPADLDAGAVEVLAEAEHWRWLVERRADGWSYAAMRNDLLKQTPALRDWGEIDDAAKETDRAFARLIPQIAARVGFSVRSEQVVTLGDDPFTDCAHIQAGALPVLILDPLVADHWTAAHAAVKAHGARLRLRWRGGQALATIEARDDLHLVLQAMDGWEFD